ncbi:MAG: hypothetical protein IJ555_01455 [Ruminococcus sp.]|nr:hypothetical protein [Ruminococcus sp.]
MAYPKPLSKKSIDKMLASWDAETVDTLHRYYEAFSELYGIVMLKDAWQVFKRFEPKIHKKQFVDFSSIARREDVPYYVFEIDEIYSEEKRFDTGRLIVNKKIVISGAYKFSRLYEIYEMQAGKPYYDKPDLLEVAAHPRYDEKILPFINELTLKSGEQRGKKFSEAFLLTDHEKFLLDWFKAEYRKKEVLKNAEIPFSQKFYEHMIKRIEGQGNPIDSIIHYLEDNGFQFETQKQAEQFIRLLQDFINKSHLWVNCGYTPTELFAKSTNTKPKSISVGPNMKKAFADGTMDREEFIRRLSAAGIEFVND